MSARAEIEEVTYPAPDDTAEVAHLAAVLLSGRAAHPHLEQLYAENPIKRQAIVYEHVKLARLILVAARVA